MWQERLLWRENCRSQMLHLKGLDPVWLLMCLFRSSEEANFNSQMSHLKGFSPVWVLMCLFRWLAWANFLLHPSHVHSYGFSPVWVLMWSFRFELCVKTFSQIEQRCAFPIFRVSAKSAYKGTFLRHNVSTHRPACFVPTSHFVTGPNFKI